jgi:hypothetical protein
MMIIPVRSLFKGDSSSYKEGKRILYFAEQIAKTGDFTNLITFSSNYIMSLQL